MQQFAHGKSAVMTGDYSMANDIQAIKAALSCADVLRETGVDPSRSFSCPFPEHADNNPSANLIKDGTQFYCHACKKGGDVIDLYGIVHGMTKKDVLSTLSERFANNSSTYQSSPKKRVEWIYDAPVYRHIYQHADKSYAYEVRRIASACGTKKKYQQGRMINNRWELGLSANHRILYSLPNIVNASRVYLVEGEKCADRLIQEGLDATTTTGGAGARLHWMESYTQALAGREVVIIPDNDEVGRMHAENILEQIKERCNAAILNLEYANVKDDVYDWYNQGGDTDTLTHLADLALNPHLCLGDSSDEVLARLDQYLHKRRSGEIRPIPTGLQGIDEVQRIEQQNLITIAARPGGGKTSMLVSMTAMQLLNQCATPAFFSFELDESTIALRIISAMTGIPFVRIQDGNLHGNEIELVRKARVAMKPLRLDDNRKTIAEMTERIKLWRDHFGVDIVYIDQLSKVKLEQGKSRFEQYSNTVNAIKLMARECNVPIVLAAQLRRPAEGMKPRAPSMNELKDTGSLEEDSDVVLCLWRPEQEDGIQQIQFKNRSTPTDGRMFIYCRKYRNGQQWKHVEHFDGQTMTVGRARA